MLDPSIFKAYDIRGIYPKQIDEDGTYRIGRAFAEYVKAPTIVVGYDMRISAPQLSKALIAGILEQGGSVIDIGMVTTDAFYFACSKHNTAGIMNTASHNPPEWTGFKMVKQIPQLIGKGLGMEDIQELATNGKFEKGQIQGTLSKDETIMEEYAIKCLSMIDPSSIKPFKIVIDAGNGMGGMISQATFKHLPGLTIVPMFFEPNGNFPNHIPDPLVAENKKMLEAKVKEEKADLGIAFDGDADRCFFIDETGYALPGDFVTALFAEWFCGKEKGAKIIYDPRASDAVPDTVHKNGGNALLERVGHTYIKKRMAKENAIFGGEVSAHYYYRDLNFCDSGIASALLLLQIISQENKSLSEIMARFKDHYFISGEINSKVESVPATLKKIEELYKDGQIEHIDGINIRFPDFHFNVRGSNTEPVIRLNLEGNTTEITEEKTSEVLSIIRG